MRRCKKCVPVWHPNGTFSLFRGFTHISYFDVLVLLLTFITGCQTSGTLNIPNGHQKRGGLAASAFFSWLMQCIVYFLASLAPKYFCRPTIMRQRRSSHRIDESKRCNKLVALILASMRHLGFLIKKLVPDDCVVQAPIKKGQGGFLNKITLRDAAMGALSEWTLGLLQADNVGIRWDAPPPSNTGKGQSQDRDPPYSKCLNIDKNPVSNYKPHTVQ